MRLPPARATTGLVLATSLAWLITRVSGLEEQAAIAGGFIPARWSGKLDLVGALPMGLTPLSATLLHGGLIHLGFNMLLLGYCGRYVELALGGGRLLLLYLVGAYAAAAAQFMAGPGDYSPMIGASGAASAILGAYALLYGNQTSRVAHPGARMVVHVLWLAAAWIGLQLLIGFATAGSGMSIAIAAHIGGFLTGLALVRPLLAWRYRHA